MCCLLLHTCTNQPTNLPTHQPTNTKKAISWGKIRIDAEPIKVCAEATLVFPLLVSQTFAKDGPKQPIARKQPVPGVKPKQLADATALHIPEGTPGYVAPVTPPPSPSS